MVKHVSHQVIPFLFIDFNRSTAYLKAVMEVYGKTCSSLGPNVTEVLLWPSFQKCLLI